MIKNDRQYRITKSQLEKFETAQAHVVDHGADGQPLHSLLVKAQRDALRSQAEDLRKELAEYDTLRSGQRRIIHVESFDQLPVALIQARIAAGMSQKDLAAKLSLPEQQVQRYEATDYASASLSRLQEVVGALGLQVRQDLFLPDAPISSDLLLLRLKDIGFDPDFVLRRLVPPTLVDRFQTGETRDEHRHVVLQVAATVGRMLGVPPSDFFVKTPTSLRSAFAGAMRFKLSGRANKPRLSAYTFYAHHLAVLLAELVSDRPIHSVPTDPAVVRTEILERYGKLTFRTALQYIWSLGIPVLPLRDRGAFHGALARIQGRNVIVLKQPTKSPAKWLFDLLHELRHASEEPGEPDLTIIEEDEMSQERRESPSEKLASRFAGDVILDSRANALVKLCATRAGKRIECLKSVVPQVAAEQGVAADALANYMAFRLSLERENWWPTANNLQEFSEDPWEFARDYLLQQVDLSRLNQTDRMLIQQALTNPGAET